MRNWPILGLIALVIAYACFEHGGVTPREWGLCMLALCGCSLILWVPGPPERFAPAPHPAFLLALILVPVSVGIQLIPLPFPILKAIDPSRAELAAAVEALNVRVPAWTPLSVAPSVTFAHLERLLAYVLMFLISRELGWRTRVWRWWLTIPVIIAATLEAALGVAQYFAGVGRANGTYVNPNHFAALLHMAFPLTVMLAVTLIRRREATQGSGTARIAIGCLLLACSATILVGALYSLSRMGLATILVSGSILASLGFLTKTHGPARVLAVAIPIAILVFVLFAAPAQLVDRFSGAHGGSEVTADVRMQFWKESGRLIAAYPLFGCGLGAYASAIQKFRNSEPLGLLQFAHNDYIQLCAELGVVGILPWIAAGAWLFAAPWRAAFSGLRARHRLLAVACASSLSAIALDTVVDFDFYVPANMLVAAWIAGIASSLISNAQESPLGRQ